MRDSWKGEEPYKKGSGGGMFPAKREEARRNDEQWFKGKYFISIITQLTLLLPIGYNNMGNKRLTDAREKAAAKQQEKYRSR